MSTFKTNFPNQRQRSFPQDELDPVSEVSDWKEEKEHTRANYLFSSGFHCQLRFKKAKARVPNLILELGKPCDGELELQSDVFPLEDFYNNESAETGFDLRVPFYVRLKKDGMHLFSSIENDVSLGDVPRSLPLQKTKEGFRLSFEMENHLFLGGGEDSHSLNKATRLYQAINSDSYGHGSPYRSQNLPCFYSPSGFMLAALSTSPLSFDFGHSREGVLSIESYGESIRLLMMIGDPEECSSAFRGIVAPSRSVPTWSRRLNFSKTTLKDQAEVEELTRNVEKRELSPATLTLDGQTWMRPESRCDFVWDQTRFEAFEKFIPKMKEKGFEICLWESPYVSTTALLFDQAQEKGFLAKDTQGETLRFDWTPPTALSHDDCTESGLVDFTNPEAWTWWKDLHRPYIKAGVHSFKTDGGNEIPFHAHFSSGQDGFSLRNRYADLYNACVSEVLHEELGSEGAVFARSGSFNGNPIKWIASQQSNWRSMRSTLKAMLNQYVGAALYVCHDVGGLYGPQPSAELFLRWSQFGLWSSHLSFNGVKAQEPWTYGDHCYQSFLNAYKIRVTLEPYFKDEFNHCTNRGVSFVRPMWAQHPQDRACLGIDDQFFAGRDVIVAPYFHSEGGRRLYLPEGKWMDLNTFSIVKGDCDFEVARSHQTPAFVHIDSAHFELFKGLRPFYKDS